MADDRHAVVHAYYDALNRTDWPRWRRLLASDFTHDVFRLPQGADAFQSLMEGYCSAFPDFHTEIVEILADGERVAVRTVASGTHLGWFLGHPPRGDHFRANGIEFFTIREGQIVSRQGIFDTLTMLQQLALYRPVTGTERAP